MRFSDDSLIQQTGLLSTFSDSSGRLHFVSSALRHCISENHIWTLSPDHSTMPQQPSLLSDSPSNLLIYLLVLSLSHLLYSSHPLFILLSLAVYLLPLTFSRFFVSLPPPPLPCPPTWPRCFVSVLFSLTVSVARLLCILGERTVCLPSPNPRPLHNYGRPWQCTGRLTPASSWRERWQARRGSRSLSILSRQWHGQSPPCHCDP